MSRFSISIITYILRTLNNGRLVTSFPLSLLLAVMPLAIAIAGYEPPPGQTPPSGGTTTSGTRGGCGNSGEISLTALAPQNHVGQTISTHPTFAWFVPDAQPYAMEFRLYEYNSSGNSQAPSRTGRKLIQKIQLQSSSGIMSLSLPQESALSVGKRYRWQVIMICDPNHPSRALVTGAEIDVVEVPPTLETELSATTNPLEKATLYAEAGVWYDAIAETLNHQTEPRARELKLALLEDLIRLEAAETPENTSQPSMRLRQIVELVR